MGAPRLHHHLRPPRPPPPLAVIGPSGRGGGGQGCSNPLSTLARTKLPSSGQENAIAHRSAPPPTTPTRARRERIPTREVAGSFRTGGTGAGGGSLKAAPGEGGPPTPRAGGQIVSTERASQRGSGARPVRSGAERRPRNQEADGSMPGRGTCPGVGGLQEAALSSMFLPLSLPL